MDHTARPVITFQVRSSQHRIKCNYRTKRYKDRRQARKDYSQKDTTWFIISKLFNQTFSIIPITVDMNIDSYMFQPQLDLKPGIVRVGNTQTRRNAMNKWK